MNKELLLTYTKFTKDFVQDVLDIDPPQQPPKRMRRRPQIFRNKLLAFPRRFYAALQHVSSVRAAMSRCRSRLISPPSPEPK